MKTPLAALALSSALLMTGCAGAASAQTAAQSTAAGVPSAAPSLTPSPTAQMTDPSSSSADAPSNEVARNLLLDQIRTGAGKTSRYLPAVRKTVKKGTDAELIDYGVQICTSGSGAGINQVISEMTSKGYTIDEANVVAMAAGFTICPTK